MGEDSFLLNSTVAFYYNEYLAIYRVTFTEHSDCIERPWMSDREVKKVIPMQSVEALRFGEVEAPTFSDIQLIRGGKVVSPTRQPLFTPTKIPGTYFC
jgi:hypothetical protein